MKGKALLTGFTLSALALPGVADAASTNRVYSSGILVLFFVGICALVVVIQLIPAIMTLWGIVKEALSGAGKEQAVKANNK